MTSAKARLVPFRAATVVALLALGCREAPPPPAVSEEPAIPEIFRDSKQLAAALERHAERVLRETVLDEIMLGATGEKVAHRKPRPTSTNTGPPPNLRADFPSPPAMELLTRLPGVPSAVTITDQGVVYTAHDDGLFAWASVGQMQGLVVSSEPVTRVQLSPDGSRLLIQTPGGVEIRSGDEFTSLAKLDGYLPPGRALWLDNERLVFAMERILDFSASSEHRVLTSAMIYTIGSGGFERPAFAAANYALLHPLPPLGIIAGTPAVPYQIQPMPGPLVIVDGARAGQYLTTPGEAADLSPCALPDGSLLVVRTWLHGGRQARALLLPAEGATDPLQLSTETALLVTASPSGRYGALVAFESPGEVSLHRFLVDDLYANGAAYGNLYQAETQLRESIRHIRSELASELGPPSSVPGPPSRQTALRLGARLTESLRKHLKVSLPAPPGDLEVLDAVLDQIGDYLPEDDALVLALGGIIAERFPESAWLFMDEDVSLSIDVTIAKAGDGLTHQLLLPFGAARERLAGRFRLAAITNHPTHKLPTFLVDNLRSPVLEAVATRLARKAAIGDRELSGTASYRAMLERYPDADPILLQAASSVARLRSDSLMQLVSAWGLVGWEPLSPEANGLLARAAYASCEPADYERLLRLSCELAPEDQELRFLWADSLTILNRPQEAEEEYRRAVRLDKDGVLQNHLEGRLRMIEKMKAEGTAP